MSRSLDIHHLATSNFDISPGVTNAILINQDPEQLSFVMKNKGGGSLIVLGVTFGMTLTGISLVDGISQRAFYGVDLNEIIMLDGPARFYLAALGSTCTIHVIRGKSSHGGA